MKEIILLRHGATRATEEFLYCGSTDLPLSEKGREALTELKKQLDYPPLTPDTYAATSGMRRTEETFSLLYGDAPHAVEPELREIDFGIFEMRSYEMLKEDPLYLQWISGEEQEKNVPPDGESGAAMTERVLAAFDRLRASHDRLLLVLHGGVIAAIMAHLFPNEGKNRFQWQPAPGCGYVITDDQYTPLKG